MSKINKQAYSVGERHGHKWCHLWADNIDELVEFALSIGLKRDWLQNSSRFPHFDIVPSYRQKAIKNGAIEISFKDWYLQNKKA